MLAKLGPQHRSRLASLLGDTPEFTRDEVAVALELIDAALGDPSSDDYRFILRLEGERVLGYACFGATPMTEGCFDLYWLAVDRASRRLGVGKELMAAVEDTLRQEGVRIVRVETAGLEVYRSTRIFYERSGYEQAGHIADFYWPGNDLHVYTKYIQR
ncbi:MAG TPA: GNAT family N-acetyltransferase [Polyangiaceae bacterium]|nr:GNAT family N-acetyltransferase [Polyangiaceae bacterium]